jgi:hypothetical protein
MKSFILITVIIFLLSCNKEDNQNIPSDIITSLSGKIDNWTLGTDKTIKFGSKYSSIILGTSSIDTFGNFNIPSLNFPDDKSLTSIDSTFAYKGISISNHNAKIYYGLILVYNSIHADNIGFVLRGNYDLSKTPYKKGDYKSLYYFVNENVIIKGNSSITVFGIENKANFNLNLEKGWNRVINRITSINSKSSSVDIISNPEIVDSLCFYED